MCISEERYCFDLVWDTHFCNSFSISFYLHSSFTFGGRSDSSCCSCYGLGYMHSQCTHTQEDCPSLPPSLPPSLKSFIPHFFDTRTNARLFHKQSIAASAPAAAVAFDSKIQNTLLLLLLLLLLPLSSSTAQKPRLNLSNALFNSPPILPPPSLPPSLFLLLYHLPHLGKPGQKPRYPLLITLIPRVLPHTQIFSQICGALK